MGKSNFGELDESPPLLVNPQLMFTCLSICRFETRLLTAIPRRLEMEFLLGDARHHATLIPHRICRSALGSSSVAITTPQVSLHSRHHLSTRTQFPPRSAPLQEANTTRSEEPRTVALKSPSFLRTFSLFRSENVISTCFKRVLNVFTIARVLATPNALMTTDASKGGFLSSLDCGEAHEKREESSRGAKGARVARPQAGWLEEGEEGDGSGQGEKGRKTREWKKSGALLDRRSSRGACLPSAE